jgi:hypothetical protein
MNSIGVTRRAGAVCKQVSKQAEVGVHLRLARVLLNAFYLLAQGQHLQARVRYVGRHALLLPLHDANGATVTLLRDATEAQCMAMACDTARDRRSRVLREAGGTFPRISAGGSRRTSRSGVATGGTEEVGATPRAFREIGPSGLSLAYALRQTSRPQTSHREACQWRERASL